MSDTLKGHKMLNEKYINWAKAHNRNYEVKDGKIYDYVQDFYFTSLPADITLDGVARIGRLELQVAGDRDFIAPDLKTIKGPLKLGEWGNNPSVFQGDFIAPNLIEVAGFLGLSNYAKPTDFSKVGFSGSLYAENYHFDIDFNSNSMDEMDGHDLYLNGFKGKLTVKDCNGKAIYPMKRDFGRTSGIFDINGKKIGIFDNVAKEVKRQIGKVYKFTDGTFGIQEGDIFSHGDTIKEARESLIYKISDRDTSAYENWNLKTKMSKCDAIRAYRTITGACESETRRFIESHPEIKYPITVANAIAVTNGQYKSEVFAQFFTREK